ncbi:MAG: antitoxin [Planctomycetes bacterium]|nr:antitoxin [Planctomycetota bacterium]
MKTTLDLPEALVKQVKLRALQQGQRFKDAVADLLRKGLLAAETTAKSQAPRITKDKKTGLPKVECWHAASSTAELTPERVAEILLAGDIGYLHAAGR